VGISPEVFPLGRDAGFLYPVAIGRGIDNRLVLSYQKVFYDTICSL